MSSLLDELIFDSLVPLEVPVRIKMKDGTIRQFVLKEAHAEAARQFRNCATRAAKMTDGRVTGVDGIADAELLLVSLCIFRRDEKADGTTMDVTISQGDIRTWKSKVVTTLFNRVKEISDLSEDEPAQKALNVGLLRGDAPIKLSALREWSEKLPDDEIFRPLKRLLRPSQEELVKNALSSGTDTSDSANGSAASSTS